MEEITSQSAGGRLAPAIAVRLDLETAVRLSLSRFGNIFPLAVGANQETMIV